MMEVRLSGLVLLWDDFEVIGVCFLKGQDGIWGVGPLMWCSVCGRVGKFRVDVDENFGPKRVQIIGLVFLWDDFGMAGVCFLKGWDEIWEVRPLMRWSVCGWIGKFGVDVYENFGPERV